MFDDEPRLTDENRPNCPACGTGMKCHDCEYVGPRADDVYEGWMLLTHFHRWETVTQVHRQRYGPISIYTTESGNQPWRYWREDKITGQPPRTAARHGSPEIRLVEGYGRDGRMWLCATQSTVISPSFSNSADLANASYVRAEHAWFVRRRPAGADEDEVTRCDSKAKARAQLKTLGRQLAKTMKVKFNPGDKAA
jgi:hypothetical protein